MPPKQHLLFFLLLTAGMLTPFAYAQNTINNKLQKELHDSLCKNMDSLTSQGILIAGSEYLSSPENVRRYYMQNNCQTVWIGRTGISPLCDSLIGVIKQSYFEGLNPDDYHLNLIEGLYNAIRVKNAGQISLNTFLSLELLLTDAFITYTSDLYAGHIHTGNENVEWKEHIMEISPIDSLNKVLINNSLKSVINNFCCAQEGYIELRKLLQKIMYLNQQGGSDTSIISAKAYLNTIVLNMERWRWLPHRMSEPYIMVNIADFTMRLVDSNKTVMDMKIIVGKTYTRTPLFNAKMLYLVLNPWWEIPPSIAKKEILPAIKKNKEYLVKNNINVYENWSPGAREICADSINWDSITPYNLTYRFRQQPGPDNALGRIKFMFPNKFNVYLHDTPEPELFLRSKRTFSHGCIRIEKPMELAAYLLKNDSSWTKETLAETLDTAINKTVLLPMPVNVYICYWTAWIDAKGEPCFRPDIYEYDKRLMELMPPADF